MCIELSSSIVSNKTLDCKGFYCPEPVFRTRLELDKMTIGEVLEVIADDPAAEADIKAWAKRAGNEILKFEKEGTILTFYIKRMK